MIGAVVDGCGPRVAASLASGVALLGFGVVAAGVAGVAPRSAWLMLVAFFCAGVASGSAYLSGLKCAITNFPEQKEQGRAIGAIVGGFGLSATVVTLIYAAFGPAELASFFLTLAVLMCFIAMKQFGVDANIVALSGIAIAIGTMVDMGVIISENILKHLDKAGPEEDRLHVVYRASSEVGGAVVTAVSTTVVSFLPVFTMIGAEGKLFRPLAFTKTFALISSVVVALISTSTRRWSSVEPERLMIRGLYLENGNRDQNQVYCERFRLCGRVYFHIWSK